MIQKINGFDQNIKMGNKTGINAASKQETDYKIEDVAEISQSFADFSTPENAFSSFVDALGRQDLEAYKKCFSWEAHIDERALQHMISAYDAIGPKASLGRKAQVVSYDRCAESYLIRGSNSSALKVKLEETGGEWKIIDYSKLTSLEKLINGYNINNPEADEIRRMIQDDPSIKSRYPESFHGNFWW